MGSPTELELHDRAEAFAQALVEGKTSPAQQALTEQACGMEPVVTQDMEWIVALLAMAWSCGYSAAIDDRTRARTGRAVRK